MVHQHQHSASTNIRTAFFLNIFFTVLEFIGGVYVNSVSIVSDAVHDLGDSISLGLSWYLQKRSSKGATKKFTFGSARFSLLGALINTIILIAGSVFVINEAVSRLITPEKSDADGMLIFAIIGVLVNGYAAWKVSKGKTLNERVVTWHMIEDVLGWVAVLVVSIILKFYDNPYLDPALSLLITAFILFNVIKRLRETLMIFLQGAPKEVSIEDIEQKIINVNCVNSTHHTHIWSLDGDSHVFTCHIKLNKLKAIEELHTCKQAVIDILKPYGFKHITIETELHNENCSMQ